ncbi:MAG: twin-arginine translocation signal domain-containing protein, partial [Pseudomonadota bacterium]
MSKMTLSRRGVLTTGAAAGAGLALPTYLPA